MSISVHEVEQFLYAEARMLDDRDFEGWLEAVVRLFVENLRRFVADRPLLNVVDKREGYVVEPSP